VHVEPHGASFVGGGLWHPASEALQRLRASIDERPRRWRRVLNDEGLRREFLSSSSSSKAGAGSGAAGKKAGGKRGKGGGDGDGDDDEVALRAFAEANKGNALKMRPKGFIAEHRDMQLLKLKNFTVMKKVADGMFTNEGGQDEVAGVIGAMVGFVSSTVIWFLSWLRGC
jgi:hypothetical protein